jgi:hypothetical protein
MGCDFYRQVSLIVKSSKTTTQYKIEREKIYDFYNDQVEYKKCTLVYEKNHQNLGQQKDASGFLNDTVVDVHENEMSVSYIKELCNKILDNDFSDVISINYCEHVYPRF